MKETLPSNMNVVWHIAGISLIEISRRFVLDNGNLGDIHIVFRKSEEDHQIPEKEFMRAFLFCVGESISHPDHIYQFLRYDHRDFAEGNLNNRDFSPSNGFYKRMSYAGFNWRQKMK